MSLYKIYFEERVLHTFYVHAKNKEESIETFYHLCDKGEMDFNIGEVIDSGITNIEKIK